jgi:hypothetical protein
MFMRTVWIGLLLWLSFWGPVWADGIAVEARVDRSVIGPGESVQLRITVTNGQGKVDLFGLTKFKVVPQGTSSSVEIINTRMTRKTSHNYLLIPKIKGYVTIPALSVTVDGKPYKTQPITLQVMTAQQAADAGAGRDMWVEAQISRADPFAGQQLTYTFRFINGVNVSDAKFQPPEFAGFKAEEIEKRNSFRKVVNGREYMITELYYLLTPLEAGAVTIEPAQLQVGVVKQERRQRRSPFDDFFNDPIFRSGRAVMRQLQTDPVEVKIRPLPPLDSGRRFSGLVGQFELQAEMEKTELRVGDSATLTIALKGRGNLMDAEAPGVQHGDDFKSYDDSPQEEIATARDGTSGSKLFRTALVPVKAGRFQLPAVELTYFDTQTENYRTLTARIPELAVQASEASRAEPVVVAPQRLNDIKKRVQFTGRDILPPKESLDALHPVRSFDLKRFVLFLVLPVLVYGIIAAVQTWRRPDATPSTLMKERAVRALKSARRDSSEKILSHLYQALTAAILCAAGRQGEALTWQEARALMKASGRPDEKAQQAADLLAAIESMNYGGAGLSSQKRDELVAQTGQMVKELTA